MAKKARVSIDYNNTACNSKKALLESMLADIEEKKTQGYEHVVLDYIAHPKVSKKQKEANIQAIESLIGELVATPYNYSVQNKKGNEGWIVYWSDSPPGFSK
jgi:hypothetical protein